MELRKAMQDLGVAILMVALALITCVFAQPVFAQSSPFSVVATVSAGYNPHLLAVNEVTNTVFALNLGYTGNQLTVIDGASNTSFTQTLPGPYQPNTMVVNPNTNKVYFDTGQIYDASSNTWSQPVLVIGRQIVLNKSTNKAYVVGENGSGSGLCSSQTVPCIQVIDEASATLSEIDLPNCVNRVFKEAVDETTNTVYVACTSAVFSIDGATNVVSTVPFNLPSPTYSFTDLDVNPDTATVLASITGGSNESNETTNYSYGQYQEGASAANVVAGVYTADTALVHLDNTNNLAFLAGSSCYYVYNPATGNALCGASSYATYPGQGGARYTRNTSNTLGVAVSSARKEFYYVIGPNNSLVVLSSATGSVYSVGVGTDPVAVAFNNTTNTLYVANLNGDSITVLQ